MSGICGIVDFDRAPVRRETCERMVRAAAHRGPDGTRYWHEGSAALAHLALSLTPESEREKQPLVDEERGLVMVADARIDNRGELIQELKPGGYLKEKAPTDAELILAAFRRWGEGCAVHLIGDFAFAVWNTRDQRLFAARDPMGVRAFFYRLEARRLLFATEVKQILAATDLPARLFEPAAGAHLAKLDLRPEWTFYEGIMRLPPAHAFIATAAGCRTWRYWDVDPAYRIEYPSESEYEEHFLEVFKEAVRCRLRGTKPAGIFLSGGLDSGSVASVAGLLLSADGHHDFPELRAYSWAFEEFAQCDERHISDLIAGHYGLPVTYVPAEESPPLADYPERGPDMDEPDLLAYRALLERGMEMARHEGTRVMISGHRGDLLMGMWIFDYLSLLRTGRLWQLGQELRDHQRVTGVPVRRAAGIYLWKPLKLALLPPGWAGWLRKPVRQLLGQTPSSLYPVWLQKGFAERTELARLVGPESRPGMGSFARDERYQAIFVQSHMRTTEWNERLTSRFGMSAVDPWSDRRLASFALAVPQREINRSGENKRLVRRSMVGVMPEKARRAAGKTSPASLYQHALKKQAQHKVLDLISGSELSARGYVDETVMWSYYEDFCHGRRAEDHRFWSALTLEMWLRYNRL